MLKIGHRGACGHEPENTLLSFRKALELGVEMIEFDVQKTRDGQVIVMHDKKVDRTTNGKGFVSKKNYAEIVKLDAGKGEKVPTLKEVLDLVDRKVKVNIELKGKNVAEPTAKIVEEYIQKKGWQENDFLVSSFDQFELKKFKKLLKKIRIGVLFSKASPNLVEIGLKMDAYSINPGLGFVDKTLVEAAHGEGLKVFVWTVNAARDITRMKEIKVDGIFSNYPDRI